MTLYGVIYHVKKELVYVLLLLNGMMFIVSNSVLELTLIKYFVSFEIFLAMYNYLRLCLNFVIRSTEKYLNIDYVPKYFVVSP